MAKQNWTLTHSPSTSIRLILQGCTLPLCRNTNRTSPLVCCHWHTVPHCTQHQKGSLKICPELAGTGPCLSFLQGSFTTAPFIQFSNIKERWQGLKPLCVEAGTPGDCTGLCDKHDSQGEICSLTFFWLVEIPWRNLLIKHCKTNASSHWSTYAWNNCRGDFQQPIKDRFLFSSLCRSACSDPLEERDL